MLLSKITLYYTSNFSSVQQVKFVFWAFCAENMRFFLFCGKKLKDIRDCFVGEVLLSENALQTATYGLVFLGTADIIKIWAEKHVCGHATQRSTDETVRFLRVGGESSMMGAEELSGS